MLDVSFHVTQYQNIIAELKGEIDRLKDKINNEEVCGRLDIEYLLETGDYFVE